MNLVDVTAYLIAAARTGKSYFFTWWITTYVIPETKLKVYTNIPIKRDVVAEYCEQKYKIPQEETLGRIHIIPREVELSWKNKEVIQWDQLSEEMQSSFTNHNKRDRKNKDPYIFAGPWHYFFDKPLAGSIIIVDEVHNFCGSSSPKPIAEAWQRWLGELGHKKALFRCLSQDAAKLADCIKHEARSCYRIRNTCFDRDPIFKIEHYDWQMLGNAFLFIPFRQLIVCQQEVRDPLNPRRTEVQGVMQTLMGEPFFSFYDSHNTPIEGAQREEDKKPFETKWQEFRRQYGAIRGRLVLLSWFINKNSRQLFPRLMLGFIGGYVMLNFMNIIMGFIHGFQDASKAMLNSTTQIESPEDGERLNVADKPEERLNAVKEQPKPSLDISAIAPDFIILKNGATLRKGDSYQGITVTDINYKERKVIINEDTTLTISF